MGDRERVAACDRGNFIENWLAGGRGLIGGKL
jgi:hypothetical protein